MPRAPSVVITPRGGVSSHARRRHHTTHSTGAPFATVTKNVKGTVDVMDKTFNPWNTLTTVQSLQALFAVALAAAAMSDTFGKPWGAMRKIDTWVYVSAAQFGFSLVAPIAIMYYMMASSSRRENAHSAAHYSPFKVYYAVMTAGSAIILFFMMAFWIRFDSHEAEFDDRYENDIMKASSGVQFMTGEWNRILLFVTVHGFVAVAHVISCNLRHNYPTLRAIPETTLGDDGSVLDVVTDEDF